MKAAGLCMLETLMNTEAVMITNPQSKHPALKQRLLDRIQGYIDSTKFQLIQYNVSRENLPVRPHRARTAAPSTPPPAPSWAPPTRHMRRPNARRRRSRLLRARSRRPSSPSSATIGWQSRPWS